jgi:hypothetical protein
MKKKRKYEKGQAVAELTIALIAIMAVFVGLLCVSALGIENIKNLITARGGADRNSYNGVIGSDSGQSIIEWNYGSDELYFTADDVPSAGSSEDGGYFAQQLDNDSTDFGDPVIFGGSTLSTNFNVLEATELFLWAAVMTSHESSQDDPLGERNLEDVRGIFGSLMGYDLDFGLEETVYMPVVSN